MFVFRQDKKAANSYRQAYLDSIEKLIASRRRKCDKNRLSRLYDIANNQQEYRRQFKNMLGWPLDSNEKIDASMSKKLEYSDSKIKIWRMQFDMLDGIKFEGLFFEHSGNEKRPLVIVQHGGFGTPEIISDMLEGGSANYNNMLKRVLKYGVNVFAPQLLMWSQEEYGIDFDRQLIDSKLKQIGSSITAIEVYCISKSIDLLSKMKSIDEKRIGMVGLSYGGFYTLFTSALDERIKSAISCSYYGDSYIEKPDFSDWVWFDAANKFFDDEVAMLVYPRYICIEVGENDELFDVAKAKENYEELRKVKGDSWFDFNAFDGMHEFFQTDEDIEKFIEKLNENYPLFK